MARIVNFTPSSIREIEQIFAFLSANASQKAVNKLIESLQHQQERLREYPEIGRKSRTSKGVHFVQVQKKYHLYYRFSATQVTILGLFDTRQDPSKRPY